MITETVKLNYLRMAPRKVRSVADLIRGLTVNEAEAQLLSQRRRPSGAILKLLRSAVANAKNNRKLNPDHLFVTEIRVDQGPMLKRMLPRARGSASPIQKKMSNVTLVLGVNENQKASQFKIVVPKKAKLPPGSDKKGKPTSSRRRAPVKENEPEGEQKGKPSKILSGKIREGKPGFFKKMFNRKSGMGN
jgi:large subunit ribosomal protein L22